MDILLILAIEQRWKVWKTTYSKYLYTSPVYLYHVRTSH